MINKRPSKNEIGIRTSIHEGGGGPKPIKKGKRGRKDKMDNLDVSHRSCCGGGANGDGNG